MSDAIEVRGLVKRFGDVHAVDGIDFAVPQGTIFGLLGPNGAGKTTTIRMLATVLPPDGGSARVLGQDVVSEAARVRRSIGLAGQFAAVDPNLTGRENLRMIGRLAHLPGKAIEPRAAELLGRFELDDAADRPVRTYSGGMRRRLDLAAALVQRPPVLFLDEPTTGLDPHSRAQVWDMVRELVNDGTTVLLTTQYMEEADRLAARIAVIDGGRVIADDTPAALKARLGSTVIELGFPTDQGAVRGVEVLAKVFADHAERQGAVVHLTSNDGARAAMDALRTLDADGIEPASLSVREPSLDDVFLSLTGRHVETEQAQPEVVRR